jgi:uncharacterized protein
VVGISDGSVSGPPRPAVDVDSKFFWDGLAEEKLLLQRCESCEHFRFPPMSHCPYCTSDKFSIEETSGQGAIYSWVVVRQAFNTAFSDQVPYTVATVDLYEGPRVAIRLEKTEGIEFGETVKMTYVNHGDWTELRATAI